MNSTFLFVCYRGDTIQYYGGLRSRDSFDSHLPHWLFLILPLCIADFFYQKLLNENLGIIKCNSENIWLPLCYAVFLQAYVWNGAHNFYETFFLHFFAAVRSSFIKSCVQILFFVKKTRAFWVKGFLAKQFQIAEYWSWLLSAAFWKIIRALKSHMTCYNLNLNSWQN